MLKTSPLHCLRTLAYFIIIFAIPLASHAIESICPGGTNPRSDISWCADHENYSNPACKNGDEDACISANGHVGHSNFAVKTGQAAIGNGTLVGVSDAGGAGPGALVAPDQTPSLSASMRFYVKFSNGYLQSNWDRGNHGPSLHSQENDCSIVYSLDWADTGPSFLVQSTCSTTFLVPNNIKTIPLKNNRWYLVEMQATMNTTTSGPGEFDGNGILRAYIDGEKILEYTNVNLRGNSNELWHSAFTARSYYSLGTPSWSGKLWYDGFVYSKTGQYIGPSANENPRGTADAKSPYLNFASHNGYIGSKMADDCSSPSGSINYTPLDGWWRNHDSISLSSEVTHGSYINLCAPENVSAPKVVLQDIEDSSRIKGTPISNSNTLNIKGKLFLPSSYSYSTAPSLVGFYKNDSAQSQLAIAISGGKWAIRQKGAGTNSIIKTSTTTATFNTWNNFELTLTRNSLLTLKINDQVVIAAFTPTVAPTWAWDDIGGNILLGQLTDPSTTPDKALKVRLTKTKDGGGITYEMVPSDRAKIYAIHGWVYLPDSNNYSGPSPIALSGIAGYGSDSVDGIGPDEWGKYIAVGIHQGKWALVQRDETLPTSTFTSNKSIVFNAWHEFEILVEKEGKVSLMIDREWLLDSLNVSSSASWVWDDNLGGPKNLVIGVTDFRGTAPFTSYVDDTDVLTASAWSCKGWSPESCPF